MRTYSCRRGSMVAIAIAVPLILGDCSGSQGRPTALAADGGAGFVATSGSLASRALIDTSGRGWRPEIRGSYVSAAGNDCAKVMLTPQSGGVPVQRVVCIEDAAWVVVAPLVQKPGEPDPRFAPTPIPGAVEKPVGETVGEVAPKPAGRKPPALSPGEAS